MEPSIQEALKSLRDNVLAKVTDHEKELGILRESLDKYVRQPGNLGPGGDLTRRDPDYPGLWPNAKMAADFGHWIMATQSPDPSVRTASAERIGKAGYTLRDRHGKFVGHGVFLKALGESADTSAAYLAPDEFIPTLIRNVKLYGVARKFLSEVPLSSARTLWPKRTGGFTVYYPDEGVAPTASDLAVGTVALTPKKWAVLTYFSRELEEDAAIALGEWIALEMALAIAIAEDTNAFKGDGTSTYAGITGVLNSANVAVVTMAATKTGFTDVTHAKLTELAYAVPDWARMDPDAAYYMSPSIMGVLAALADSTGRPLYQPATDQFPMRVNGFPVRSVNAMPGTGDSAVATKFIAFGSLRLWDYLGQRRSFAIERNDNVKWPEGQVAIMACPRQDIQEADGDALAVLKTAAA